MCESCPEVPFFCYQGDASCYLCPGLSSAFALAILSLMIFLVCLHFLQSQRTRQHRNMRAKQTSPTQTSQPKTRIKGHTESTSSRGTTDHLASTETLTFPDRVRSLRRTAQAASSGEARRGGLEAPQIKRRTTTGRFGTRRVFLHPFQRRSCAPKTPSSRWMAVEVSCRDPEVEVEVATRLKGDRLRITHQQPNNQTPILMTWRGEEATNSQTE